MKKALTLGMLLLGCCLAAAAQTTPNQTPPVSTPPTFPQDQTGQSPSNPSNPSDPSAIPPDTDAPGMTHGQAADQETQSPSSQMTTIQGCLSQSQSGNFMLADNSGNSFQLRGDAAKLASYIGNEVKVDGIAMTTGSNAGAMSSPNSADSGSMAGTSAQFNVNNVRKLSDTCTAASSNSR